MTTTRSEASFAEASETLTKFREHASHFAKLDDAARRTAAAFRAGNKLLACGNGGSACEAMHLCEELTGRFHKDRPALPAIACIDPGHLTCVGNDYGYDAVFSRWVEALGKPGDVLFLFSTSGNSKNIVEACNAGKRLGLVTFALLGNTGGTLAGKCDLEWIVPSTKAERVQEVHQIIMHTLIALVEREMFAGIV